jgi:ABC-type Fe3+-hydroxamate transport system substrate-binding protein
MPVFTDQTGRIITLDKIPQRIISVVPSQTELLSDLGLEKQVTGITKFCVHPRRWFESKTRVGGTKELNIKLIHELKPDLILANKEENLKEQIEELEKHYPVWVSNITDPEDACKMITGIGEMTGKARKATEMTNRIKERFAQLQTLNHKPQAAYLIWQKPYMTVGGDTFIHSMLKVAGFENIFASHERYPEITIDELLADNYELLFLPSEPFPFKQKHIVELKAKNVKAKIFLVDGEMFSWYGSRMLRAPAYFRELHLRLNY